MIADGYDADLDELRALQTNHGDFLLQFEAAEKARTGLQISKLSTTAYMDFILKSVAPKLKMHQQNIAAAKRLKMLNVLLHQNLKPLRTKC